MVRKKSGKFLHVLLTLALVAGLLPALPQWAGAGIIGSYVTYQVGAYNEGPVQVENESDTSMELYDVDIDQTSADAGTITMYFESAPWCEPIDLTFSGGTLTSFVSVSGPTWHYNEGSYDEYMTGGAVGIDPGNPKILHFQMMQADTAFSGYATWTFTTTSTASATEPSVTTTAVTDFTATTATMGGNVTSDGGATVTARGVVYSADDATPTIGEAKVTVDANGSGTGAFSESVAGLSGNTIYYMRAYATNSIGTTYGPVVSFTTSATVPGAPTIDSVSAGDGQALVTFSAPASNGGAAITGYTVTSSPDGRTGTGTDTSPITVTGLTNGVAYTFTVTATNAVGTGPASAPSNAVTPKGPQTITFTTADSYDFGTTPTLTATATSGLPVTFTSADTSVCTVTAGGALSFVKAGTATIHADQAGNSEYQAAPRVTKSFTVNAVVPGTPAIGTATAGDRQASVAFTAPSSTGGSAITGYTVTSSPGGFTGTGASSPITVVGLTNGTAYTFTVTATNSAGTGSASAASNSVTPKAPQSITFNNPGAQNFGTTPTLSATASSGLPVTFSTSTSGICDVTPEGLVTFKAAGTATINAEQPGNNEYDAAPLVTQSFTVNAIVPGAPTIGTATAGDEQATVAFTAPSSTGGTAITGYTVTSSPEGITGTGAASPITVTGLTNGVAYTFTVTATNSAGTGAASAASISVTPKAEQTITFANPGTQNFGTTPTLTAISSSGLPVSFSSTTDVASITTGGLLTFHKTGTATIVAHQVGDGSYLPAPTVSRSFEVVAVAPGAPTGVTATAGNAEANVSFTAPDFTGGAAITSYTVTASPGGITVTGTDTTILVTGLTNGTTYSFTVTATNSKGTGAASTASNAVTPLTVPGAPTAVTATAGDTQASVAFTAPASDGGAAITSYTVTDNSGEIIATGSASPITVTGLTNGTEYTFTVTATNSVGTSSASATSNAVTPKAPQTITFFNPGAQNFGTSPWITATSTSHLPVTFTSETEGVCTITPEGVLTFVTAGTATITAHQDGNSEYLAAAPVQQSFTVNAIVPGAPSIGTVTAGNGQASVAFTAPSSNGGIAILSYTATSNPGSITGTSAGGSPITVTGLTNGVAYTFTVTATNSVGTGAASAASNAVTPKAPQTITFNNPGAQNFGTTPMLSATASSGLPVTFSTSTSGICDVTPEGLLTFKAAGTATIHADQPGNGAYLAAATVSRSFTVNPVVPGAPTVGTVTAGDTQASVSFTPPAFSGGTGITGYMVTSNPGGFTGVGAASPITVSGLTNGVAYTFTVTATNSAGTGPSSTASAAVTPKAAQVITFANPGAQNFGTTPTLSATSDSHLEVTFTSSTPDVCTVTPDGVLTFLKAGEATVVAHQAGSASYLPASDVSRTFTVNAVLPGAPAITAAAAGDAKATVSFTTPVSNGGTDITSYTVTSTPGGFTGSGATSPITVTGLTNGTAYTFTVTATNTVGTGVSSAASAAVTPKKPDDRGPSGVPSGVPVIVNGESQNIGSQQTQTVDGKTVSTVSVNDAMLEQKLEREGSGATVTIPISSGADIAVGALNGQTVKNMESKDAVLQISTPTATYSLPALEINIDDVSDKMGQSVALKDIVVKVSISEPPEDTAKIVEDTADKNSYQLVVKPVDFEITCSSGDKTVEVSKFNGYVERTVAVPEGIDPAKITTGIVLNRDGTFSHVPTEIVVIDGKYYAKINSLTNSTYSVIYNPMEFADMAAHWAKNSVNNMGARLVVTGVGGGNYEPDSDISRAQFAAIVVRALGLAPETADSGFDDVKSSDWYCGYVETAARYGIITGYGNGNFGPADKITREQAMLMIARAMKITGLDAKLTDGEAQELLQGFADAGDVSVYAKTQVASCLKTGVITGRDGGKIAPNEYITRAEVAVIVERLLQKSGLI